MVVLYSITPYCQYKITVKNCIYLSDNTVMDFDVTVFWDRVKALIRKNGFTQRSLSEKMGFTTRTVETWINQKTIPNAYQTYLLSQELRTTVEYLVTGRTTDNAEVIELLKRALAKLS